MEKFKYVTIKCETEKEARIVFNSLDIAAKIKEILNLGGNNNIENRRKSDEFFNIMEKEFNKLGIYRNES